MSAAQIWSAGEAVSAISPARVATAPSAHVDQTRARKSRSALSSKTLRLTACSAAMTAMTVVMDTPAMPRQTAPPSAGRLREESPGRLRTVRVRM